MNLEKLKVKSELVLGDLILSAGDVVDGIKVTKKTYKIFVRTGWWAVSANCFT